MTRKRYVKLMMARGWSRNQANQLAYLVRKDNPAMTQDVRKALSANIQALMDAIDELMEALPDA